MSGAPAAAAVAASPRTIANVPQERPIFFATCCSIEQREPRHPPHILREPIPIESILGNHLPAGKPDTLRFGHAWRAKSGWVAQLIPDVTPPRGGIGDSGGGGEGKGRRERGVLRRGSDVVFARLIARLTGNTAALSLDAPGSGGDGDGDAAAAAASASAPPPRPPREHVCVLVPDLSNDPAVVLAAAARLQENHPGVEVLPFLWPSGGGALHFEAFAPVLAAPALLRFLSMASQRFRASAASGGGRDPPLPTPSTISLLCHGKGCALLKYALQIEAPGANTGLKDNEVSVFDNVLLVAADVPARHHVEEWVGGLKPGKAVFIFVNQDDHTLGRTAEVVAAGAHTRRLGSDLEDAVPTRRRVYVEVQSAASATRGYHTDHVRVPGLGQMLHDVLTGNAPTSMYAEQADGRGIISFKVSSASSSSSTTTPSSSYSSSSSSSASAAAAGGEGNNDNGQ